MNHESKTAVLMVRLTGTAVDSAETLAGIPTKLSFITADKEGLNLIVRTTKWAIHNGVDVSIRSLPHTIPPGLDHPTELSESETC